MHLPLVLFSGHETGRYLKNSVVKREGILWLRGSKWEGIVFGRDPFFGVKVEGTLYNFKK